MYKAGERVTFKKDNSFFEATITGIKMNGDLIINTGTETAIPAGSLEWVID